MILKLLIFMNILFVGADETLHASCTFNPLCTCSQTAPNLGIVSCVNVPLPRIPVHMNRSKINSFHLENNGMKVLEPYFMFGTGLITLKISQNPLYVFHDDTFKGLDFSLRDLELSYLKLNKVPLNVLRSLQKLRTLNLAGNEISDINSNNWVHVRNTLETLILKNNAITSITRNTFEKFPELKTLDLSRNALRDMDPDAFFSYSTNSKLINLNLADNQLFYIPYAQMQHLKSLKTLDLSYNFISNINAISESTRSAIQMKFSLNSLHLEYNNIKNLVEEDFQKFAVVNRTFFDGNPISMIQIGTFEATQIHEISFSGCGLGQFHSEMIKGLEQHLHVLDLSNNDLFSLDPNLFQKFLHLQELKTKGNKIDDVKIPEYNGGLLGVEFGGAKHLNWLTLLQGLGRIKSLIRVSISNVLIPYLSYDSFIGYGLGVEEMSITHAELKAVKIQAFINVRGLKKLDLSNNEIDSVHELAFAEIGHSLLKLYLSNAFARTAKIFPEKAMQPLNILRVLDISFNNFEELPINSFHAMPELEVLRAHDCRFRGLNPGIFTADVHVKLKEISLSFNFIEILKKWTFVDLPELRYLNLEDNFIKSIESRAFENLQKLRWLYLKGNKISFINPEAFENLPELELLDLSFNNLKEFDFVTLDQVGSFASFNLNISFNELDYLRTYSLESDDLEPFSSNVKVLDVSNNIIYDIYDTFFLPLESSLTHLYASNNFLCNMSCEIFGSLSQLQLLDLSENQIRTVERDVFHNITNLQILNLRKNRIGHIEPNQFASMRNLRIVDLSENKLEYLPELLFRDDSLEKVSISWNKFVKIPFKSFSPDAGSSLREFDVSHNMISSFHAPDLFSRFKSLISLDISYNRLNGVQDYVFRPLNNLAYLHLSCNNLSNLISNSRFFHGVENSLIYLGMRNTSLNEAPEFSLPKLIHLHLSSNNISSFTPDTLFNVTNLRVLDLSDNNLTSIPEVIRSRSLKSLNLSRNAIKVLTNNSLLSGFYELRELDISHLQLETFETGALSTLESLITLHLNTYTKVDRFNIPKILQKNLVLENLWLTASKNNLDQEMKGQFPKKLRNFIFLGKNLQSVDSKILEGVSFPRISLKFEGTQLETLQRDIFWNMPIVRNISVDVRNNSLKTMSNPSTGTVLGSNNHTFLIDLKVSDNRWICDCYVGWIESWKRMKRQLFCRYFEFSESKEYHNCLRTEDDLRRTLCSNKPSSLIDVMKVELECGWSRSSYVYAVKIPYIILPLIWTYFNLFW